jgi:hypothetical protein
MRPLVEIEFHPRFPKSLKKETLSALRDVLPLAAIEVATLRVTLGDADMPSGAVAAISVSRAYRAATLWLSQEFFAYSKAEKNAILLHEMGHVVLDALTREMTRVVNFYIADEATRKHLMEHFEEEEDRVVEGLAMAWKERYNS